MDKLTDFFRELKDRASNPLFSSFAISWLIINWKVSIGLFCSTAVLREDGYKSYIDLIEKNYSGSGYIVFPLLAAVFYTFVFPIIRACILAFQTKVKSWSNDWNLEISKDATISVQRYIGLRQLYKKREELIEEILKGEGQYVEEKKLLTKQMVDMQNDRNEARRQIGTYENANKVEFLNGVWKFYYHPTGEGASETVQISGGKMHILEKSGSTELRYVITDYCCNPVMRNIVFRRSSPSNKAEWAYHSLDYDQNFTMLKGVENVDKEIRYKRLE